MSASPLVQQAVGRVDDLSETLRQQTLRIVGDLGYARGFVAGSVTGSLIGASVGISGFAFIMYVILPRLFG